MEWNLKTYSGVLYEGDIWFSNNTFNGLFRMNVLTKKIEYVDSFPRVPMLNRLTHKKCFLYGDKLLFLPAFSNYIHIYDLNSYSFETINFVDSNEPVTRDRVSDAAIVGHRIFVFSWLENEPVFIFDLNTNRLEKSILFETKKRDFEFSSEHLLTRCFNNATEKICFALWDTDCIVEWDVNKEELVANHTGVNNLFSAIPIGEDVWMVTRNSNKIYKYNKEKKIIVCNGIDFGEANIGARSYSGVSAHHNRVLGIPAFSKKFVCWKDDFAYEIKGDKFEVSNENLSAFLTSVDLGDELWFLPFSADGIYAYNANEDAIKRVKFSLESRDDRIRVISKVFNERMQNGIVCEDSNTSLRDFMEYICN